MAKLPHNWITLCTMCGAFFIGQIRNFFKKVLTYVYVYDIIISGGEKQMSRKKKKSKIDYKTLAVSSIMDLIIGIILLILDKLLN